MGKDFYLKMVESEVEYAEALESSAEDLKNILVKTIMRAVAQDSIKHSLIYKSIVSLMGEKGPMISEDERDRIAEEIERHIKVEEVMIKMVSEALSKGVESSVVEFLLRSILKDEYYHHSLLKNIYEAIVSNESLTESDIWEMVWRDAAYHGTPGG
jgi:rubrerythrin